MSDRTRPGRLPADPDDETIRLRHWLVVVAIAISAVLLRMASLAWQQQYFLFEWSDPDGYLQQAGALTRSGTWRWTWDAVSYTWGNVLWTLPPGYPVFLSLFYSSASSSPQAAALAQCVAGGFTCIPVFVLASALHTRRAGVLAAFAWAVWFPNVAGRGFFVQEQIYLPLLTVALAALAVCLRRSAPVAWFGLAGLLFATATLTRAMPLFFLTGLLPVLWLGAPSRRLGGRRALAFTFGFLLLVGPYVTAVSAARGQLVLIDDHMTIVTGAPVGGRPARFGSAVATYVERLVGEAGETMNLARGFFKVYGTSWTFHAAPARNATTARYTDVAVHVFSDTLFVVVVLLAPIGLALARQRVMALVLVGWIAFVVVASALTGFSGARYRSPIEIPLICAAAVVLAGRYRLAARWPVAVAVAWVLALAIDVLPQYVDSWTARLPYGFDRSTRVGVQTWMEARGPIGFYVLPIDGVISIEMEAPPDDAPLEIAVAVDRRVVTLTRLYEGRVARVVFSERRSGVVFVELIPSVSTPPTSVSYQVRLPN